MMTAAPPTLQAGSEGLLHQRTKPLANLLIERLAAAKPLPRTALFKPELEDGLVHGTTRNDQQR